MRGGTVRLSHPSEFAPGETCLQEPGRPSGKITDMGADIIVSFADSGHQSKLLVVHNETVPGRCGGIREQEGLLVDAGAMRI